MTHNMKRNRLLPTMLTGLFICLVNASEICYRRDVLGHENYIKCKDSCCGTLENKYCCQKTEVGIIAGCVVGVVVFFGIAVSVINCCCCHRRERQGYTKVSEGSQSYGSGTYYDIPRTPSGPNIPEYVDFVAEEDTERKLTVSDTNNVNAAEAVVDIEVEVVAKREDPLVETNTTDEIIKEAASDDSRDNVLTKESEITTSGGDLEVKGKLIDDVNVSNTNKYPPVVIVTDIDSPTGRHSYVRINTENNLSEPCILDSRSQLVHENGNSSYDDEVVSDDTPLLQKWDRYSEQTDVYIDKSKAKTILITDLDTDITEEISDFNISGDFGGSSLPDFAASQAESDLLDLTLSHDESTASGITITQEESIISGSSLLPDLVISEDEKDSSKLPPKEEIEIDMGNQNQSVEKVYVYDSQPKDAYVTSGPYPPNRVEAYSVDEPRTDVIVDDSTPSMDAYIHNSRPYDPGPSAAYAYPQPAGMAAFNQPYGDNPVSAYNQPYGSDPAVAYSTPSSQPAGAYNRPIDAYDDSQPYRSDGPMDAFPDNQPYGSDTGFAGSADAYVTSDDQPSDAY